MVTDKRGFMELTDNDKVQLVSVRVNENIPTPSCTIKRNFVSPECAKRIQKMLDEANVNLETDNIKFEFPSDE